MSGSKQSPFSSFPVTSWTRIKRAFAEQRCDSSLEFFCKHYWPAIQVTLVHKFGFSHHDAEDLTQDFVHWLLQEQRGDKADPELGRFRSFLLGRLDGFVSNARQRKSAQKRGGTAQHIELTQLTTEPRSAEPGPVEQLQSAWAYATLEAATDMLRQSYEKRKRTALFEKLLPYLSASSSEEGVALAATELGMSLPAFFMARSRFRAAYSDCLRSLVSRMVVDQAEFDEEMALIRAVAG